MRDTYSLYEAKAKLSAIVRRVREGHTVVVTVHGEPAVAMRPLTPATGNLAARLEALAERGLLLEAAAPRRRLRPGRAKPGALRRFLDDRDG